MGGGDLTHFTIFPSVSLTLLNVWRIWTGSCSGIQYLGNSSSLNKAYKSTKVYLFETNKLEHFLKYTFVPPDALFSEDELAGSCYHTLHHSKKTPPPEDRVSLLPVIRINFFKSNFF